MKQLKLTVIVPTRERLNTLVWSIKTLTEQNYENLEIIISDNFCQDGTSDYIKALKDPRIKHVNTGKRVSMTENWEFALSHATGDYVTFIGDDDGIALGALKKCNELLNDIKTKALIWRKASYIWEGYAAKDISNTVSLPKNNESVRLNAKEELQKILQFRKYTEFEVPAYFLPCLYNGFIKKDVLDLAREKQGGKFFHSKNPDIYSSTLLPFFIDDYIYSSTPYGVNGASANSNGTGMVLLTLQKNHKEAERFEKENTIDFHPKLKIFDYSNAPFYTMESYLHACDSLKIEPELFDVQKLCAGAVAYTNRFTPDTLPWTIKSAEETCKINGTTYYKTNVEKQKRGWPARKFVAAALKCNKKIYVSYLRAYRKKDIVILDKSYPANILGACRMVGEKLNWT